MLNSQYYDRKSRIITNAIVYYSNLYKQWILSIIV